MVRPFCSCWPGKPAFAIRLVVWALAVPCYSAALLISNIALPSTASKFLILPRCLRRRTALSLSPRRNDGVAAPAQAWLCSKSLQAKSRAAVAERDRGQTRARAFDKMGSRRQACCSGARRAPSPIGSPQYHGDCAAACDAACARNADGDRTGLCGQDGIDRATCRQHPRAAA